jgi:type IV secretory pathway TrbD component
MPLGYSRHATVGLRDRNCAIVEAHQSLQHATGDSWRTGRHPYECPSTGARERHNSVPFHPSSTVLLGRSGRAYDVVVAKGWDRLSLEVNTRPVRVERDIRREDLLAPSSESIVLLLGACLLCGVMLSVLYVFFPLLLITFAGFDLGGWLLGSVVVAAVASSIGLYLWERRARRDFLNEL